MERMEIGREIKNRSDYMNKHDLKKREEVGYKDMEKYECGGLEVEELLTNGYLMYVPYGIHNDIFKAMEVGNTSILKRIDELKKIIKDTEVSDMPQKIKEQCIKNFNYQIEDYQKHVSVLEKIQPLVHLI
jgi:hypothetical protein